MSSTSWIDTSKPELWGWTDEYPSGYIHFDKIGVTEQPKYKPSMPSFKHGKNIVQMILNQGTTQNMAPRLKSSQHPPMKATPINLEGFCVPSNTQYLSRSDQINSLVALLFLLMIIYFLF